MIWFVCTVCTDVIECFVEEEGKLHTYLLTCTYTFLLTYLLPVKPLVYRAVRRLASREKEPLLKTRQKNEIATHILFCMYFLLYMTLILGELSWYLEAEVVSEFLNQLSITNRKVFHYFIPSALGLGTDRRIWMKM